MKVILKQDVESLGKAGDMVNVADGYARNYLIPRGLCMEAIGKNLKVLEQQKKVLEKKAAQMKGKAVMLGEQLKNASVTVARKVGEQEKLFGSVTSKDIEKALHEQGIVVDRRCILLDEPIKSLGDYHVRVKLHHDVFSEVKVTVTGEGEVF